jgi:hypothetical protein
MPMINRLEISLPRPLQWAEYIIRLKSGGSWGGMAMPMPGDAMGMMSSLLASCR